MTGWTLTAVLGNLALAAFVLAKLLAYRAELDRLAGRHEREREITAAIHAEEIEELTATVPAPAPRAIPSAAATALTAEAFLRAWQSAPADSELLAAVHQVLAIETVAALDDAATPALADRPGTLAHAQGQAHALMQLAATLHTAHQHPEQWLPKPPR